MIRQYLKTELSYFRKLNPVAQKLIISYSIYNLVDPLIWLFIYTFLWRSTNDVVLVGLYNLAIFFGLPTGFLLNGLFLKKYSPVTVYTLGSILQGIIALLLIFTPQITNELSIAFGFFFGLAISFFWANRNLFTLRLVNNEQRIYFSSLENLTGTLTNIVIPAITGWFIVFGERAGIYTPSQAYRFLSIIGVMLLIAVGLTVKNIAYDHERIRSLFVSPVTNAVARLRIFMVFYGLISGVKNYLPTLLVLIFLGQEDVVGLVQSIAFALSAIVMYEFGKRASTRHRIIFIGVSVIFYIFASLSLGILFSPLGVLLFSVFFAFANSFSWVGSSSLFNEVIYNEQELQKKHPYPYLLEQEFFLNAGRIFAMSSLLISYLIIKTAALRYSLIIFSLFQIGLFFIAKKMHEA